MAKKFATREAAFAYIDLLTINQIKTMLADFLVDNQAEKIVITEEQFKQFFKVRGLDAEGKVERRGRPRKEEKAGE